jgi:hypothetical protein
MLRRTWSGAASRVLREAARRRALQLALLVGGLFALGFLFGGQAQAAEGVPVPSPATAAEASAPVHGERVVRPAHEAVTTVTEQVAPASPRVSAPALPAFPDVAGRAGLPDLTDSTDLSGLPSLPSLPPSPLRMLPVPVTEVHGPGAAGKSSPAPRGSGGALEASASVYGPVASVPGAPGGAGAAPYGSVQAHTRTGPAPAHQGPAGDPGGVLGGASVLDGAASRHGDAHAVTQGPDMPLRLLPGGAVRSYVSEIQDRHRDVPVFPG